MRAKVNQYASEKVNASLLKYGHLKIYKTLFIS